VFNNNNNNISLERKKNTTLLESSSSIRLREIDIFLGLNANERIIDNEEN